MSRFFNWLYIVYCFQIGILLLIFPWHQSWQDNYFFYLFPSTEEIFLNHYVRGGISGLGIIDIFIGSIEVINYRRHGRSDVGPRRIKRDLKLDPSLDPPSDMPGY